MGHISVGLLELQLPSGVEYNGVHSLKYGTKVRI